MRDNIRIGIDVGGTNIEACSVPVNAQSTADITYVHKDYPKGATCTQLCSVLRDCIDELLIKTQSTYDCVECVGIATPGSIDLVHGTILHAYNLNLHNAHITDYMESLLPDLCFTIINDADAAALGEFKFGALRGVSSGCLFTLGTGVGAGLIINGDIYQGGMKRGTEIGHMTLDLHGSVCTCGNVGCIETACSATALAAAAGAAYSDNTISAKMLTDRAKQGDSTALAVFNEYINALSSAIASYMTLLDPERVVVGGGVSLAGDFLFEPLRRSTQNKCFFDPICDIIMATLGDKAGAVGAAFAPMIHE